jgi:hypothetical protein
MGIKINNQSIAKLYLGNIAVVRAYSNGSIVYDSSVTPTPQPCFEVVDTITNASGNYVDVYATDTQKWYKLNNLGQYEEYGVVGEAYDLSTLTYYTGKLAVCTEDDHEYKWDGSTWIDQGDCGRTCIFQGGNNGTYKMEFGYYWNYHYEATLRTKKTSNYSDGVPIQTGSSHGSCTSPIELGWHQSGFFLDRHNPKGTSTYECNNTDFDKRTYKWNCLGSYTSTWLDFVLQFDSVYVKRNGTTVASSTGAWSSITAWYTGLYYGSIQLNSSNKASISSLIIRDENNNIKHNYIFRVNRSLSSTEKLCLYDKITQIEYPGYNNSVTPNYTFEGTRTLPVSYDTKTAPADNVHYNTLAELELMECPWYGMQATIGSDNIHFTYTQSGWEPDYLKFTVIDDNGSMFAFNNTGLKYSIDNGSWTTLEHSTYTPTVAKGSNIRFRGNLTPDGTGDGKCGIFTTTGTCNVSGYIGTLLYGKSYSGQTDKFVSNALQAMFQSTKIVDASALVLPSVNNRNLYNGMFKGASQLVTPPISLNFTNAAYYGTTGMFMNCTSMTTVPSMTITSGSNATGAFQSMFQGCSSIVNADNIVLDLGTLPWDAMTTMFSGCTSLQKTPIIKSNLAQSSARHAFLTCNQLTNIKYLGTTTPSSTNSLGWLPSGCTATFYMNQNATWDQSVTRDESGVPSGCTITKIDPSSV